MTTLAISERLEARAVRDNETILRATLAIANGETFSDDAEQSLADALLRTGRAFSELEAEAAELRELRDLSTTDWRSLYERHNAELEQAGAALKAFEEKEILARRLALRQALQDCQASASQAYASMRRANDLRAKLAVLLNVEASAPARAIVGDTETAMLSGSNVERATARPRRTRQED